MICAQKDVHLCKSLCSRGSCDSRYENGGVIAGQAVPVFLSEMAPASYRGNQQDHTKSPCVRTWRVPIQMLAASPFCCEYQRLQLVALPVGLTDPVLYYTGAVNNLFQLATTTGILVAQLVNYGVHRAGPWAWRISLAVAGCCSITPVSCMPSMGCMQVPAVFLVTVNGACLQ